MVSADGTLAGSALTTDQAVRNAIDALRMASETPAKVLGFSEKGRSAVGADADLLVLDAERMVEETIVAGESIYPKGAESHGR